VRFIRISAFDHPNVVLKNPEFIPGAQSEMGLARLLTKYRSTDNPMYLSRAEGICPMQAWDSVIRWDWCIQAGARTDVEDGPEAFGVDVANSEKGDPGVIARGKGARLLEVEEHPCPNGLAFGTTVWQRAQERKIPPQYIGIDGVGVGAAAVKEVDRLAGAFCTDLQSGEAQWPIADFDGTPQREHFRNLRAQMWWQMRQDLQFGRIALPEDHELFVELCTPKWELSRDKIITVQSKKELREQLGRSPDRADGAVYWNWVRKDRRVLSAALSTDIPGADIRRSMADILPPRETRHHRTW
jgi:hypothetical protein